MNLAHSLLLTLAAMIWGGAFVAQKTGIEHIPPCAFNALRSFVGAAVLLPLVWLSRFWRKSDVTAYRRTDFVAGAAICGTLFAASSLLQQLGLVYSSPAKAGFLTALYIVIVPLLGCLRGRCPPLLTWIGVVLAIIGVYLLSVKGYFTIERGDFMLILCAVGFSLHIIAIDHFSRRVDCLKLSCAQIAVCAVISSIPALFVERFGIPQNGETAGEAMRVVISAIGAGWKALAFTGILSTGVAYTLQMIAQRRLKPVVATLIMSLESVFAALFGWLILKNLLSPRELAGCTLVFIAVSLAQIPERPVNRRCTATNLS